MIDLNLLCLIRLKYLHSFLNEAVHLQVMVIGYKFPQYFVVV